MIGQSLRVPTEFADPNSVCAAFMRGHERAFASVPIRRDGGVSITRLSLPSSFCCSRCCASATKRLPSRTFPQPAKSPELSAFQSRVDAVVLALRESDPRFKSLSPEAAQGLVEFVSGNMLFVLLHELGHAVITQMGLPVLGRMEDAADTFAVFMLLQMGFRFFPPGADRCRRGLVLCRPPRSKDGAEGRLLLRARPQ